jgi:hypothetical protein
MGYQRIEELLQCPNAYGQEEISLYYKRNIGSTIKSNNTIILATGLKIYIELVAKGNIITDYKFYLCTIIYY